MDDGLGRNSVEYRTPGFSGFHTRRHLGSAVARREPRGDHARSVMRERLEGVEGGGRPRDDGVGAVVSVRMILLADLRPVERASRGRVLRVGAVMVVVDVGAGVVGGMVGVLICYGDWW